MILGYVLLVSSAYAALPEHGESVLKLQDGQRRSSLSTIPDQSEGVQLEQKKAVVKMTRSSAITEEGNLPRYLRGQARISGDADSQVYIAGKTNVHLKSVHSGDIFKAVIEQEITASGSVPTPIRAQVISGSLKGAFFVGEATLDRELKRILIQFTKLRSSDGTTYSIRASGLSQKGSVGIEGEYHSELSKFFMGELASATAAGVLDSTISRNQTTLGTYVQEPSLSNSAKTGAVTALSKTADRFSEQAKQAPEYTKTEGYQEIQIIVTDDPIEAMGG